MGACHSHTHSHDHSDGKSTKQVDIHKSSNGIDTNHKLPLVDKDEEKPRENLNVRAAMIHAVGDLAQSVGIFIAALLIYFKVKLCVLYNDMQYVL